MADRTTSPPRKDRKSKSGGGFRWKDKDSSDKRGDEDRDRGPRRRSASPRRREEKSDNNRRERDREDKPEKITTTTGEENERKKEKKERKKEKKEKKPKRTGPQEPMIVVHVNDRLGTKADIPCFASDRIEQFKMLVAGVVGRKPHEILIKRQGERPFKDALTLEDYGVSNGVQLDLEVDTGD